MYICVCDLVCLGNSTRDWESQRVFHFGMVRHSNGHYVNLYRRKEYPHIYISSHPRHIILSIDSKHFKAFSTIHVLDGWSAYTDLPPGLLPHSHMDIFITDVGRGRRGQPAQWSGLHVYTDTSGQMTTRWPLDDRWPFPLRGVSTCANSTLPPPDLLEHQA